MFYPSRHRKSIFMQILHNLKCKLYFYFLKKSSEQKQTKGLVIVADWVPWEAESEIEISMQDSSGIVLGSTAVERRGREQDLGRGRAETQFSIICNLSQPSQEIKRWDDLSELC